jgi:hypothetical protein
VKLRCKLIAGSDVEHLHQIYAGFAMLHRAGEIELSQQIPREACLNKDRPGRWNDYRFFNTTVVVNGSVRITYDTHDRAWIDPEILDASDLYFKRSYSPENATAKVRPLGLNMQVNDAARDMFRLRRSPMYGGADRVKTMLKALRLDAMLGTSEVERLDNFEHGPNTKLEPRVLFMARLWDPKNIESKVQADAVEQMNASRAVSITKLRKELADKFFGGVAHDEYSRKYFPEALIADDSLSQKRKYLEKLKEFPICVATVGLNGSNGWKLAEYVAASKAIISEPLVYEVTGNFGPDRNYLEFTSPERLIEQAVKLVEDAELRNSMMQNNREYYLQYVRPDALVRRTLEIVSELL